MIRPLVVVLSLLVLAACGKVPGPISSAHAAPGQAINVSALLGLATGVPATWSLEGAGAIDPTTGVYTAPDCAFWAAPGAPPLPHTAIVSASVGQARVSLSLIIEELVKAIEVACFLPAGVTTCQDPSAGIRLEPGGTGQFFARVTATCSRTFDPPLPAGACPPDPAFAFCQ